jgi:hypothetical protein
LEMYQIMTRLISKSCIPMTLLVRNCLVNCKC